MIMQMHPPVGDKEHPQHPLPINWEEIAEQADKLPQRFGAVEEGKLYRSAIVWPNQVKTLKQQYGIVNLISLIDGNWLEEFRLDDSITIYQFPVLQRAELTFERVKTIVDHINRLEEPSLVHCLKGSTRTGMVCAGYSIINEQKSHLGAIVENMLYDFWSVFNTHATKEILRYNR